MVTDLQSRELVIGMSLMTQGADQLTGTAAYVRGLLTELGLRSERVRVQVLCNANALTAFGACASPRVTLTHATGYGVGRSRVHRAKAFVRASLGSARLARQFWPEVRVVHYPLTLAVPTVHMPTVVSLHDVQHHDLPENFSSGARLWRSLYYDGPARRATLVVTLSEYSRNRIIETLDVEPQRVVVIPLAVDHRRFRPEPDARDDEWLAPLELPERFVFFPATLWPHKNHMGLLDSLARVADDSVHLVLCGASFGRLDEVLAMADRRGIGHRVKHLGLIPDAALPAVYRRAKAVVFPSTYEGFGIPPLEAMASGCPVASTLAGPLAEVCGDAALALQTDDPDQMAGAIERVIDDQPLRARLRAAGFAQAREFSWARVADAHVAAYDRASEERRRTKP